jgi:hypothetical protein
MWYFWTIKSKRRVARKVKMILVCLVIRKECNLQDIESRLDSIIELEHNVLIKMNIYMFNVHEVPQTHFGLSHLKETLMTHVELQM